MVGDKEQCRLSPFVNIFSKLFSNDGTTANAQPGSDKDCMLQLLGWFTDVTPLSCFRGIAMKFSSLLLYHNDSMLG